MVDITLEEAQLMRMVAGFFGKERIVYKASLSLVCGEKLTEPNNFNGHEFSEWAKRYKCLFTVMNDNGDPRLVIELLPDITGTIDSSQIEHMHFVKPTLNAAGLHHVTLSREEFADLTDPEGTLDFFSLLESKIEINVEALA